MRTVTVSTSNGRTLTTDNPFELSERLRLWGVRAPHVVVALVMRDRIEEAGNAVAADEINFAAAGPSAPAYVVPVDPADATQCDSCQ